MSKMDSLRAMREAKYAANSARSSSSSPARPAPRAKPAQPVPPAAVSTPASAPAGATDELCGHRNMSGRSCTRERGHTAKSHRYS